MVEGVEKPTKVRIPLGVDCSIAHYLRQENLREEAFPFDWNITPVCSAIELLKNGFDGFLERDNLVILPAAKRMLFHENGVDVRVSDDVVTPVLCRRYRILFPHDFSEAGLADLGTVKLKYQKRIDRLLDYISRPVEKVFIYRIGKINSWQNDQYSQAGVRFEDCTGREAVANFNSLSLVRSGVVSFDRYVAMRGGFKARSKYMVKAWLRSFGMVHV